MNCSSENNFYKHISILVYSNKSNYHFEKKNTKNIHSINKNNAINEF